MEHLPFFSFILISLIGLPCAALVVLSVKNIRANKALRNFILVSLLLGVLYSIVFYRQLILMIHEWDTIMRIGGSALLITQIYCWLRLMTEVSLPDRMQPSGKMQPPSMMQPPDRRLSLSGGMSRSLHTTVNALFVLCALMSTVNMLFFVDGYFRIAGDAFLPTAIALQSMNCIVLVGSSVFYAHKALQDIKNRFDRIFVMFTSLTLILNCLWISFTGISLFIGAYTLYDTGYVLFTVTSILVAVSNLIMLIYVIKRDRAVDSSRADIR